MGEEQTSKRKHFLLYSTCLLAILLMNCGCATCLNIQNRWQCRNRLDQAEILLNNSDFEGALKADQAVMELFPQSFPGDQALFHMGIIWVHPENPNKDYNTALECFQMLINKFPGSDLRMEAGAWIATINRLICDEKRFEALESTIGDLKKQLNTLKEIDIRTEEKKREEPIQK